MLGGTTKGNCEIGPAKAVWMGWTRADGQNNGTKGGAPNRKRLEDATPIT